MLAASTLSSNVPPDNLQPPPVSGAPGIAAKQLAKAAAMPVPQSNPSGSLQQHAARLKAGRVPLPVRFKQLDATICAKTESPAYLPGALQVAQLPAGHRSPQATSDQLQPRGSRQTQDDEGRHHGERCPGPQNNPA